MSCATKTFICSDGRSLSYSCGGEGKNVLFLHGWGGDLESFSYFAKGAAAAGYRAASIAFAGFGASDPPSGAWGIADYCKDVTELLDSLGMDKVSVVGHSFGGRAALYIAASFPERVDKLILTGCAGLKPKRGLRYRYRVWRYKRLKRKGKDTSKFGSADYKSVSGEMRASFIKIVNEDLTPLLKKIRIPALLVWGKGDKDTPLYMAKRLLKGIKGSGLVKLDGGHYAYAEKPQEFLRILLHYLGAK